MTRYYNNSFKSGSISSLLYSSCRISFKVFSLFAVLMLFSCEEPPTTIGSGLLPERDFISIKSNGSLPVYSFTEYGDSVRSDNQTYSYLGTMYDPYFGKTSSEFVTQLRLGSTWAGDIATVDSVKLYLTFTNVSGDTDSQQTLKISEISEELIPDTPYYSNYPVQTAHEIAEVVLPALRADTVNNIALRLPDDFGTYITRDLSKLFHSSNEPDFNSYFKGAYFRITNATKPLLLTTKLSAPGDYEYYKNFFALYYKNTSGVQNVFYFIMDARSGNVSINRYSHDFSAAEPEKMIKHINDSFKDSVSFLQSFNGAFTRLQIPGLAAYRDSMPLAVNKARLMVPVYLDNDIYKVTTVPGQIYLKYTLASGIQSIVPDYSINARFFDGTFNNTARVYYFNIASFVQKYLEDSTGAISPELEMFLPEGTTSNVILTANDNSNPVKFELTFTKL